MMTLNFKGIKRKCIVSTNDSQLFEEYKQWLHDNQTFTQHQGNTYMFPSDTYVTACVTIARKRGLDTQEI